MITPADDFDDGPDLDPDDPLAVILRPASGHLGPPPGRYEEIRRGASRRRLLRAAAGVGATCAVAALAVLLPLRLTASDAPVRPVVPLAPPPMSGPSTVPTPTPAPTVAPVTERPTEGAATPVPGPRSSTAATVTAAPTTARTPSQSPPSAEPSTPSVTPSASSARR
ncbi:hypothetical protein [Streptomyces sp. NBC_01235]|uniref:hypothetical protein n=1 Tax=Streptomyces sp. NBC_01235 TaxID=2903788 RepID=UPI002E0E7443|nr:hypothetical protein OG289_35775 [Streptomyces sp. NBC_01235]